MLTLPNGTGPNCTRLWKRATLVNSIYCKSPVNKCRVSVWDRPTLMDGCPTVWRYVVTLELIPSEVRREGEERGGRGEKVMAQEEMRRTSFPGLPTPKVAAAVIDAEWQIIHLQPREGLPLSPGQPSGTTRYLGIGRRLEGVIWAASPFSPDECPPPPPRVRWGRDSAPPGSEDTRSASRPGPEAERSIRRGQRCDV
ncbi:unnamed protein product [Arctogadus glacialis]